MFAFANPGQFFGPAQMLDAYKNIECNLTGGTAVVSINKYRNANHGSHAAGGCQEAEKIKNALIATGRDVLKRAGGNKTFVEVFLGKGSPWAIGTVLELLVESADAFINKFGNASKASPERKCADLLADDNLSWQAALQAICDGWLGLDCNGFVGNWLKVVQPDFKLNQDSKSENVRPKAKTIRKRVEEFEYWDIMCYANNEHIAVINEPASSPKRFWICQSAGGGPRNNEYGIYPTGKNKVTGLNTFRLAAPTARDIGTDFYVVSLW
jgi:hypothetical protein